MKSLWAQYHEETEDHRVIEEADGFIHFSLSPPVCAIHNLYVVPEKRRTRLAWDLADRVTQIARDAGCTDIWSEIGLKSKTCNEAMQANLAYGFRMHSTAGKFILMNKPISKD